jgi:hypothetical protein
VKGRPFLRGTPPRGFYRSHGHDALGLLAAARSYAKEVRHNLEAIRGRGAHSAERLAELAARLDIVALKRLVVLGVVLRVVLVFVTSGSNDIFTWERFGRQIADRGVLAEYQETRKFNHPPLMGLWARSVVRVADHTSVPFCVTFKLLSLAADGLGLWLMYALAKRHGGKLHRGGWRLSFRRASSRSSSPDTTATPTAPVPCSRSRRWRSWPMDGGPSSRAWPSPPR